MPDSSILKAAELLINAASSQLPCGPIRNIIGDTDINNAYQVQKLVCADKERNGAKIIGRKIGLTSFAVQKQLGVDQPDFGVLFDDMEILNGWTLPWNELMQPKIEAEIAFVMSKDLVGSAITTSQVLSSVEYALASLEIVGSRIENWDIRITDTIADNAAASHFVLGHNPTSINEVDLINCKMEMYKNGAMVSSGKGSDCLGSPINALVWLARKSANLGDPIKAGDIILSGALGPMTNLEPGDEVFAEIHGLGQVSLKIGSN